MLTQMEFRKLSTNGLTFEKSPVDFSHQDPTAMILFHEFRNQSLICLQKNDVTPILILYSQKVIILSVPEKPFLWQWVERETRASVNISKEPLDRIRDYLLHESDQKMKYMLHDTRIELNIPVTP